MNAKLIVIGIKFENNCHLTLREVLYEYQTETLLSVRIESKKITKMKLITRKKS